MSFAERWEEVRLRVAAACARSGRAAGDVSILPVSKTCGPDQIAEAAAAGVAAFGENRVQEAVQKIPLCPGHLEWHMIGHLQRNKVRLVVEWFRMIHSIDSLRLLETVDAACGEAGKTIPVCLEVNVSGERSKNGMAPEEVLPALSAAQGLMNVDVVGLMTIPPFTEDPEEARPFFRQLRELRDRARSETGVPLDVLSMGMSRDFEIAVEEGATWIRIGSLLFGSRK
jgi:pyridoxal phosphate enzyme (YggS family)